MSDTQHTIVTKKSRTETNQWETTCAWLSSSQVDDSRPRHPTFLSPLSASHRRRAQTTHGVSVLFFFVSVPPSSFQYDFVCYDCIRKNELFSVTYDRLSGSNSARVCILDYFCMIHCELYSTYQLVVDHDTSQKNQKINRTFINSYVCLRSND